MKSLHSRWFKSSFIALVLTTSVGKEMAQAADGTTDNWSAPNSSLYKSGNWASGTPTAGVIGVINDTASTNGNVLGLSVGANGSVGAAFGAFDLTGVAGGATENVGTYSTSNNPSNFNVTWTLGGAIVNSATTGISNINTIFANSSGETLNIENGATPSGKPANTGTLTLLLGNSNNLIQSTTAGSNISINVVVANTDGSHASGITYLGAGGGTLSLNGVNTYSGGTTVSSGAVSVGNTSGLGTGAVSVAGGALSTTVANVGVGGTLSLTSGSIALSAGASPTLQLALNQSFTMSGGTLSLASGSNGLGSIASLGGGAFTITSGTLDLNNSITNYGQSYDVLTGFNSSSSSVNGPTITDYDSTDFTATLSDSGVLSFNAVATPEPSTWILIVGAFALIVFFTRRRSQPVI